VITGAQVMNPIKTGGDLRCSGNEPH
jgi:hypothetical protein